jgi:hypothetical protein
VDSANGELNHDKKKYLTMKIDISNVEIKTSLTCSPARADLVWGVFLFLEVNLPPLPFPPFPAYNRVVRYVNPESAKLQAGSGKDRKLRQNF